MGCPETRLIGYVEADTYNSVVALAGDGAIDETVATKVAWPGESAPWLVLDGAFGAMRVNIRDEHGWQHVVHGVPTRVYGKQLLVSVSRADLTSRARLWFGTGPVVLPARASREIAVTLMGAPVSDGASEALVLSYRGGLDSPGLRLATRNVTALERPAVLVSAVSSAPRRTNLGALGSEVLATTLLMTITPPVTDDFNMMDYQLPPFDGALIITANSTSVIAVSGGV